MKNFPVDVWWPVYEANAAHFAVFGVSGVVHQRVYRGLGHGGMSRVHGALAESVERRTRTLGAGERWSETVIQISEGKEEKASRDEDGGRAREKERAIPRSKRAEERNAARRGAKQMEIWQRKRERERRIEPSAGGSEKGAARRRGRLHRGSWNEREEISQRERERRSAEKRREQTVEEEEPWFEREGARDGYSAAWRVALAVGRG